MSHRFEHIDCLRAISALCVIVAHVSREMYENFPSALTPLEYNTALFFRTYFDPGKFGVMVFFCISGFLIPNSLSSKRPFPLSTFAISRLFRLYPAYWLSILAALCILGFPNAEASMPTVAANMTMLQRLFGLPDIQGVYWTLAVELVFYMSCMLLFGAGLLHNPRSIFLVATGLLAVAFAMAFARYATAMPWPVALPLSLSIMYWSYSWRLSLVEKDQQAKRASGRFLSILAVAMPPIIFWAYYADRGFGETWYRNLATVSAAIVFFIVFTKYYRITSRWLQFLGMISYSLYLFGSLLITAIAAHVFAHAGHFPVVATATVCIAGAVAIATLTYFLVERPAIRFGKGLNRRLAGLNAIRFAHAAPAVKSLDNPIDE